MEGVLYPKIVKKMISLKMQTIIYEKYVLLFLCRKYKNTYICLY